MADVTAKLAEALRLISFASMDRGARDTATEALRLYEQAKAQQAEPVAWLVDRGDKGKLWYTKLPSDADIAAHGLGPFVPLFAAPMAATPAPADELAEMLNGLGFDGQCPESIGITLKDWRDGYAKWLGAATPAPAPLTTAQFERLYNNLPPSIQQDARSRLAFIRIGRAVEAAHGIGDSTGGGNG